MGPLSRYPKGLVDFWGLKSGGKNPTDASDTIAITQEITRFLQWSQYEESDVLNYPVTSGVTSLIGAGTYALDLIEYQPNEVLLVNAFSASAISINAASQYFPSFNFGFLTPNVSSLFVAFDPAYTPFISSINANTYLKRKTGYGLWVLPAGSRFALDFEQPPIGQVGGSQAVDVVVNFSRLRV